MKTLVHPVLVVACVLAFCGIAVAKGSGGGHGSGGHGRHGSGGHGGHASSGHGGGGHSSGGSHGSSGGHASGGASHGSSSHGTGARRASSGAARATAATGAASSSRRTAGGPVVGTAVPRTPSSSLAGPLPFTRLVPFYAGPGFGYGHRLFYDPFLYRSGFGSPSYAYGYSLGAAYSGFGNAPDPFGRDGPTGSIRLIVEPRNAVVLVDGYYAGVVDDFDGHFQRLDLTAGPHHIEINAPGYQPLGIDVAIQARHTNEYRGTLIRARP